MLSRRSILRALGLGAPAAAVAAVVGAPAVAEATLATKRSHAATLALPGRVMTGERLDASRLFVIDANMGSLTAGQVLGIERDERFFARQSELMAIRNRLRGGGA